MPTNRKSAKPKTGKGRGILKQAAPSAGSIHGKRLLVPPGPVGANHHDLETYLCQFNLTWLLRTLGELSAQLEFAASRTIEGGLVTHFALKYAALVAIEVSTDRVDRIATPKEVIYALSIVYQLPDDDIDGGPDNPWEFLIRQAFFQQRPPVTLNAVARCWLLFAVIWKQLPDVDRDFDVRDALGKMLGMELHQFLVLSVLYGGQARRQRGYLSQSIANGAWPILNERGVQVDDVGLYFARVGATYDQIRAKSPPGNPKAGRQYRYNVLVSFPIIKPDVPPEGREDIFLVPVMALLVERVGLGIYHDLSSLVVSISQSPGSRYRNLFRNVFGHVLEEYVARLFDASHGALSVLRAQKYKRGKEEVDTCDVIVREGNRALLVEVKQSALYLAAKASGDMSDIAKDLKQTLGEGAAQLVQFKKDFLEDLVPGITGIREVELLLVSMDNVPYANSIIRQQIVAGGLAQAKDVHICSVEELEILQTFFWRSAGIVTALRDKRENTRFSQMDVRDWVPNLKRSGLSKHPYLAEVFKGISTDVLKTTKS